jgi:hypothetical protein
MKQTFIFTIILFLTLTAFGQQPKVTADTFSLTLQPRFSFKSIIIRSDSTYCLRETGCTSSLLTMGFWAKQRDTFLLSGLYNSSVTARTETLTTENPNDTLITFQVRDCYGNPIPKYFIDFYTMDLMFDTSHLTDNRTDDKGILMLRRDKFNFYTTETDVANLDDNQGNYNDLTYRPIFQNAKKITITISFPKTLIEDNLGDNFYKYKSRKFLLKNKQLLDIEKGNSYMMK